MLRLKCELDLEHIKLVALAMPTQTDGTGILMANGQWRGIPAMGEKLWMEVAADLFRAIRSVADTIGHKPTLLLRHVMVNTIPPGVSSGWHVDPEPGGLRHKRWHLPLVTNDKCWFQEEGSLPTVMRVGWWWGPVRYWEPHVVWNSGPVDRTHLILDLA